jgi:hypothetical protein
MRRFAGDEYLSAVISRVMTTPSTLSNLRVSGIGSPSIVRTLTFQRTAVPLE